MPPLSVLIPAYGHAAFLPEAIEAALHQDCSETVEIRILNDGSPDNTEEILTRYADHIVAETQTNAGQAVTRNRLWRACEGEFIAFLDDDDWWPEDKLRWQIEALRKRPEVVMVFGHAIEHSSDGQRLLSPAFVPNAAGIWPEHLFLENPIRSPGQTLIRRSALEAIGGFDESLRGSDDWDLYIRLAKIGPVLYQDRLALHYREHSTNASHTQWLHMFEGCKKVQRTHLGPWPRFGRIRLWCKAQLNLRKALGIAAGDHFLHLAFLSQQAGEKKASRKHIRHAFSANPALVFRSDWWRKWKRSL